MKKLAWYMAVVIGYFQLYYLSELLGFSNSMDKSTSFWLTVIFTPFCIFLYKYLKGTK